MVATTLIPLILPIFFAISLGFAVFTTIYRLFLHPLSKFPGPRLAAITQWYQFYHDVIRGGKYLSMIPGFEAEYESKIIRIGPNSLHINNPEYYMEAFTESSYRKAPCFWESLPWPNALANITDPKKHSLERRMFAPLLNGSSVEMLMPSLATRLQQLGEVLDRCAEAGDAIELQKYFVLIAADMTSEATFGVAESLSDNQEELDETANLYQSFLIHSILFQYFPLLSNLLDILPTWFVNMLIPAYVKLRKNCEQQVESIRKRRNEGKTVSHRGQPTLCDIILDCPPEKYWRPIDDDYIINNAIMFSVGGATSLAYAVQAATFHLLTHPPVLARLKLELKESDYYVKNWDFVKIQQLEYLTAVIRETFRLTPSVPGFLPRVVPDTGAMVAGQFIPGGTCFSVTQQSVNMDTGLFPEPHLFKPERWLGESGLAMRKWTIAFGKGRHYCVGQKLAYLQVYGCLAYMFSEFELELDDPQISTMQSDSYLGSVNRESIKFKIRGRNSC
ncbi:cytochrome P450 [Aspergillus californicus]